MYEAQSLIRDNLATAHVDSWATIAAPGAFWSAAERIAMVEAARAATGCTLCTDRKAALSPFAIDGIHDGDTTPPEPLPEPITDVIHRIRTDPARLTRAAFEVVIEAGFSEQQYVELVSVVNASVIVDTLHASLGLELPQLPEPIPGVPTGEDNPEAIHDGAWLPILAAPRDMADHGLPMVPNIARSLGLVPSAGVLFFGTFRPHYALKDIPLSISQAQAEFVASRVSAINECFY